MRKKLKLLTSLSTFCLAIAVLCFGVFAAIKVTYSVSGTISYEVNDAYVEIQTKLYKSQSYMSKLDLRNKVDEIAELSVSTEPSGLSLVDTSGVYSNVNPTVEPEYVNENLKFATTGEDVAYAYFYVISVKNLSADVNVWAIMQDELTLPDNVFMLDNAAQQQIDTNGKNMVIGLAVDDMTTSVESSEEVNFSYGINIGSGDLATQEFNLAKLDTDSLTNGEVLAVDTSISGVVVVPASYTTNDQTVEITTLAESAFDSCENVRAVILPDTIETLNLYSFGWCYNLTNVNLPDSVKNIEPYVFHSCVSLVKVVFPEEVDSFSNGIFNMSEEGYGNLMHVTLPTNITKIGWNTFDGCSSLEEITLPNTIQIIEPAFNSCVNLKSINIPSSVKSIENDAFSSCYSLASVTFAENSQLESIGENAFVNCASLTEITIPSSVKSIEKEAFVGCKNLVTMIVEEENDVYTSRDNSDVEKNCIIDKSNKTLTHSCANTNIPTDGSVTSIGDSAFYGASLTEINIPSSVTSIADSAFYGASLTEITIPSSVASIGTHAFYNTPWLDSLTANANGLKIVTARDNASVKYLIEAVKESLPADGIITEEMLTGVKAIAGGAFYKRYYSLKEITIPSSVTNIGNSAFSSCYSLEEVTFMHTSGTVEIGYDAFSLTKSGAVATFADGASWSDVTNTYTTSTVLTNLHSTTSGQTKTWTITKNS